jgi:hypothetical protein
MLVSKAKGNKMFCLGSQKKFDGDKHSSLLCQAFSDEKRKKNELLFEENTRKQSYKHLILS